MYLAVRSFLLAPARRHPRVWFCRLGLLHPPNRCRLDCNIGCVCARRYGHQLLDGFFLNLKITGTGVVFPIAQPNSQLTSNTPAYVFQNRSLSFRTNTDVGVGDAASNYFGFDSSDDGSGPPLAAGNPSPVSLNSTNNLLFARVSLAGVTAGDIQH